ncbi:MAG: hypothetical protein B6I38_00010 [Anaerolineaceae bacterium 4572_5.1]|nr:MAG: hypothetical protein B6I38_00010 [Anaerolineaceae bacterium 4572_5.1]
MSEPTPDIERKYSELGREGGILGNAIIAETEAVDGVGRYRYFVNGAIYWHPNIGARVIVGDIRQEWNRRALSAVGQVEINLQAANGDYVVAKLGGGGQVNANRPVAQAWEKFTLIRKDDAGTLNSGDTVYLQTLNNHYLAAIDGVVKATAIGRDSTTLFKIIKVNGLGEIGVDDKIALQAHDGRYVVAEFGGGNVVNANRPQIRTWKTFSLTFMGRGERSSLGYPLEDVIDPDQKVARFQHGVIDLTLIGGFALHPEIRKKWLALEKDGRSIGAPTDDSQPIEPPEEFERRGGYYSKFKKGNIFWTPHTGAHDVRGKILNRWQTLKDTDRFLEYPITDQLETEDGLAHYNHFEWGSIYWLKGAKQAHELHSYIRSKWSELGDQATPYIYLRASNGDYVVAEEGGQIEANVNRTIRGPWETFTLINLPKNVNNELHHGDNIHLQTVNGSFLQAVNGGGGAVKATQTPAGEWETLEIIKVIGSGQIRPGDKIALKTDNGHYLTAENGGGGALTTAGTFIGLWETFSIEFLGGGEQVLGYPNGTQTYDKINKIYEGHFENGELELKDLDAALSFFQQNMALLPFEWNADMNEVYQGTDREAALDRLIDYLNTHQPNIVGLSECFNQSEREKIKTELQPIYPNVIEGPQEGDPLDRNSGLMLLFKNGFDTIQDDHWVITTPDNSHHATVFRQYSNEHRWANRGALHQRIQVQSDDKRSYEFDLFLTQLQTPEQIAHLHSFIEAYRRPGQPALLMGDLNIDALDGRALGSGRPGQYRLIVEQLKAVGSLGQRNGANGKDITADDPAGAFTPDQPPRPADDPARRQTGTRPDYFLSWPGWQYLPRYQGADVAIIQTENKRDISDHYGLQTRMKDLQKWTLSLNKPVSKVTVTLVGFHCLTKIPGSDPDRPYFEMDVNGIPLDTRDQIVEVVSDGDRQTYPIEVNLDAKKIEVPAPVDPPLTEIEITVRGCDQNSFTDDDPNSHSPFRNLPDVKIGEATLTIPLTELLALPQQTSRRVLLLKGDCFLEEPEGEYAVTVEIVATNQI